MNIRWFAALCAALLFTSCDLQDSKPQADRGTNDETSSFYLQDGQKASNATVTVYVAGGTDTLPTTRSYTNSDGEVKLSVLPKGYYSLLVTDKSGRAVFVDSVYSDGVNMNIPSDTLRPTGSIKGKIKVQTQDDPKIAWVALVGEGHFHTIDDDSGFFKLTGMPAGRHTLVAKTDFGEYTSTFRSAMVVPDSTIDIGTIDLVYTGLPIVTGIVGTWDSLGGAVALRWDAAASPKVKGYNVYRSTSNDPAGEKLLQYVDSGRNTLVDTLFQREYWESGKISADTAYVRYRVAAIGQAGAEGSRWNAWSDTLRRPFLVAQLPATWRMISNALPAYASRLDTLPGCLLAFGMNDDGGTTVWKSTDDGATWNSMYTDAMASRLGAPTWGLFEAVVYQGAIRWVKPIVSGRQIPPSFPTSGLPNLDLVDSLRVFRMDASGHIDSISIAAANDSISNATLVLDSAGLVLIDGMIGYGPATSIQYFVPVSRRLETANGTWLAGDWAAWYKIIFDNNFTWSHPTVRSVSIQGRTVVHSDATGGALLDLDTLTLSANGSLSYASPAAPTTWHKVKGGPSWVSGIAWKDKTIHVIGEGVVWTVSLP